MSLMRAQHRLQRSQAVRRHSALLEIRPSFARLLPDQQPEPPRITPADLAPAEPLWHEDDRGRGPPRGHDGLGRGGYAGGYGGGRGGGRDGGRRPGGALPDARRTGWCM